VDLRSLKVLVSRILPPSSTLRSLVLAEDDHLPLSEAVAKFEIFDRLLLKELGR
jgi:hypothetical protein